ncbi:MAG: family 43 glycosylhydrolase [Bacteroidaceae bacterium]|nr:family 43 glycosylhydrolase [Bacteroidaceae bacterium]
MRLFKTLSVLAFMAIGIPASASAEGRRTFCNPLDVVVGNERAVRGGEPVVIIYQDDYYLFVSHRKGYWYSPDFQDWTYVDAPNYPGGVVSVVEMDGQLIGCSMNNKNVYRCLDAKAGKWEVCGELSSDRYGDANMFVDDDGRLYMYFGWSQIMPFQVVELDKTTFKEIGEPVQLFWSDIKNHGFEVRKPEDVIYSIFNGRRDYGPEELPWIEGPYMIKHNGKYYLQYAAIGLEFISYSHGVYVSDSPMGPFTYSEHNPLTFKTSGFQVGAGHGSTFHDKKGNLWTICMIPAQYGEGGRGSELAIYPTAVDKKGVMYSNTALGDYPQFYPADRKEGGVDNYVDWKLLSVGKRAIVSSTFEDYAPKQALDEDFTTCWVAETGNPGEFFTVDLGAEASINAIQLNWDHIGAARSGGMGGFGGGMGMGGRGNASARTEQLYQCYEVLVSSDNANWTSIISKPENKMELKHDYNELEQPVKARYVKVVNVATYDGAKFSIKDLRIFGTTPDMWTKPVKKFMALRNPEDRREANIVWEPVPGADGYIVRYGIEKKKLYNSYIVYDKTSLYMHSLNTAPEYYFEVEAFDSGLDFYRENPLAAIGMGAEIQLAKGQGSFAYRGSSTTVYQMLKEGQTEYRFEITEPGNYVLNHSYGPVLWSGELTEKDIISKESNPKPTVTSFLTQMGAGTAVTGTLEMKVIPGPEGGTMVVIFTNNH